MNKSQEEMEKEAVRFLVDNSFGTHLAKTLVDMIVEGKVPHVKFTGENHE